MEEGKISFDATGIYSMLGDILAHQKVIYYLLTKDLDSTEQEILFKQKSVERIKALTQLDADNLISLDSESLAALASDKASLLQQITDLKSKNSE